MISVTRLGDILSVFSTNVLTKSAQIVSDFLGYLEKMSLLSKNCSDCHLWQHFGHWRLVSRRQSSLVTGLGKI